MDGLAEFNFLPGKRTDKRISSSPSGKPHDRPYATSSLNAPVLSKPPPARQHHSAAEAPNVIHGAEPVVRVVRVIDLAALFGGYARA